jgi:uncharacterized protein (DUF2461 family)
MKRIIVKNSDKLSSMIHAQKVVDEYLIYLLDDERLVSAEVVYSTVDKNKFVDKLLEEHFDVEDNRYLEDLVEEVTFSEYLTQFDNFKFQDND